VTLPPFTGAILRWKRRLTNGSSIGRAVRVGRGVVASLLSVSLWMRQTQSEAGEGC
jgi:hypothetical protein